MAPISSLSTRARSFFTLSVESVQPILFCDVGIGRVRELRSQIVKEAPNRDGKVAKNEKRTPIAHCNFLTGHCRMKLNLLVATSQLSSRSGKLLGTGTMAALADLAKEMETCGIAGDIYDLPNGSRNPDKASPFSLNSGFAQNTDELILFQIPELLQNESLLTHVKRLAAIYRENYRKNRTVSYMLKRTVMPWILEVCYEKFLNSLQGMREEQYRQFLETARFWLEEYALYEVYKEQSVDLQNRRYAQLEHPSTKEFADRHRKRIEYYTYCQFLYFEQRQRLRQELKNRHVAITVNLPFGVELSSADVFFHPEVFDTDFQVGCSPEPEHGYPEQAWGIAAYRERSEGLRRYLKEKMEWLSLMGDGVFLDHMVGWCGQYVLPMSIPEESEYPHGFFLTEDRAQREENMEWFLDILLDADLEIKGEIAGDFARVEATRSAVDRKIAAGYEIGAMAIPRWESVSNRPKPLQDYRPSTLTMVETHDTSTLVQYITNQKGDREDFEPPETIRQVGTRVLGLPLFPGDIPWRLEKVDQKVWEELCRRSLEGVPAENVLFTLPGLVSIIAEEYRTSSIRNNINHKPGTSGTVGNEWRNWSYFSPPVETLSRNGPLRRFLNDFGKRRFRPFDYFHDWKIGNPEIQALYSKIGHRKVVYRDSQGIWQTLESLCEAEGETVLLELLFRNRSEEERWDSVDLREIMPLINGEYCFWDLNDNRRRYRYPTANLQKEHLFIKLAPKQIHHFLITC